MKQKSAKVAKKDREREWALLEGFGVWHLSGEADADPAPSLSLLPSVSNWFSLRPSSLNILSFFDSLVR